MKFINAEFEAAYGLSRQLPPSSVPEIAFSGRSNVGKSSLINKILNRKALARTSSTPGKTATVNFYRVDGVRLADLPGYGFAKVADGEKRRWGELMDAYFTTGRDIRLVVQLVDMRHGPSDDDCSMMSFMSENGIPFIVVATKSDKLNKTQFASNLAALREDIDAIVPDIDIIPFSALKGTGADEVRRLISKAVE
ncbi:MAG: ribosome biogenesis GTP-binding protein YihA/YsxC [Firmicutes bacterium]|nr:ribosome biogenesis GTP-binding protein YihA/YsxC [Bacillota bacterium]